MTSTPVEVEIRDGVAVLRMDDGKANALSPAMLTSLSVGLERAQAEARAVVIAGREGRFCAGFDLKIMGSGPQAATELVRTGCDFFMQLYEHPQPVVLACTGHAMAGGAVMLLCGDLRVGAAGEHRIGLNEVAIGLPLPAFVSELARDRLSRRAFQAATVCATIYGPAEAAEVGYLDRVVPPEKVLEEAEAEARRLAALPGAAFASTKRSIRGPLVAEVRATVDDDLERVMRDGQG